ncbi:hypothetical protein ID866_11166 [Astraeus odoratus]|nr:hypothetical protein ID866_11166 [Astraeus odoratus]
MTERTTERRQKHEEEEEKRIWAEAEQKAWEEEEKSWRAEEAKQRAEEAEKAAEVQRRTVERQCKPSVVIPMGGSSHSWTKAAGGMTCKQRRMQTKEDDGDNEDNKDNKAEGEGDFAVLPALAQEHTDVLGTLTMTLSVLLKEFKGYCHEQWDLQACQVRGLKALQREMRKANTLKVKELEATAKGKEKAAEVTEESSESSEEEEEVKDGNEGGAAKGEGDNRDRDVEMGVAPLASAM